MWFGGLGLNLNYDFSRAKRGIPGRWGTLGITVGGINDIFLSKRREDLLYC
jgi:hypothetical protein